MKACSLCMFLFLSLLVAFVFFGAACSDDEDDNDDAEDDDAVDDDQVDDDATDDDVVDDDMVDDDTGDDDVAPAFYVYTRLTEEASELVAQEAQTGTETVLVDNHLNVKPTVSPDGQTIVWDSNLHDPEPGINFATMIYRMEGIDGTPERITDEDYTLVTENRAAFAPDGSYLAYVRSHMSEPPANMERIWFINLDGTDRHALYPGDTVSRNDFYPAFSPDGTMLTFVSDGDNFSGEIYVADLTAKAATRVRLTDSDMAVQNNNFPFFDATGEWVYFESNRNDSYGLYRVAVTGGEPELVWDIGIGSVDPYIGSANYSEFRPTHDRGGLACLGVGNGAYQGFIIDGMTAPFTPEAVTDSAEECVDLYWYRP